MINTFTFIFTYMYLFVCNDIITDGVRTLYLQNSLLVSF